MAKWINRGVDCICSNCNKEVIDDGWNIGEYTTPYCPWCGLAMENPYFGNDYLGTICKDMEIEPRKVYAVYGEYEDHEGYIAEELISMHETEDDAAERMKKLLREQTYPVKWEDGQYSDFRVVCWDVEPIEKQV